MSLTRGCDLCEWPDRFTKNSVLFSMLVEMFFTGKAAVWLLLSNSTWKEERVRLAN